MRYVKYGLGLIAFGLLVFISWLTMTPAPQGVLVLEYHHICDDIGDDGESYAVPPADFQEQLDYLQRAGYTTITMQDFMRAKKGKQELPAKPVILTFDDGYEDNYTTLLPILEERHMNGTVYMITNSIGRKGYLSWNQLRDMQNRGIELGSHTANHQPLTSLEREKQIEEMKLSKLLMEWNGLKTIYTFSYPNGAYDETMPELLQENEYLTAVTGDGGLNTFQTNPYLLQRINIPRPRLGLTEFKLRIFKAEALTKLGIKQHLVKE
ncbi:Polysaccharide deacetylase [Selenomonas ruminantium]|uniref:Polysaccharide deacetylase n=1 Tax=Selenomonas ruminantium TaxID=971 RepID=A0A1M6VQ56_SELRU|nr:polysaccharide deacetylase family protein [Selenomonas ruminantium]SHK83633.1 Polysaccharide deacetylase [Selenomonas ruminantium]